MSERLRTLIVDDERLARAELKRLLAAHPQIEVVGEAADAQQALHLLATLTPDLAFLDIQMPGMSGLQLAEEIEDRCQFVFCTAYDSFAIDAFGLNALDYLVKPVVPERLARTLQRVRARGRPAAPVYLPSDHGLLLKFGDNARIVRLHDINRFESIGNHAAVYTTHGKSFLLSSLNRIEQRLDPAHFFRVSRSDILRLDAIQRFELDIGLIAHLVDGSAVAVSRRQAQVLKARMGGL
ncbi:MAG: LytTR family DNA-binding domain-containing protein [Xanthomonadaceae bacterium]|nr:LytTR family DNA-binding domain-containing protein [Xanthomonadaceae bacterium]MDZ4114464.1 LytTR family DNA-binding domain-containing protein [Xanthomonadaceae bacterium]MDZ4379684.1 LytTR family DNA-binding domain-containing protein [Xanthomonadaceae bacterium]